MVRERVRSGQVTERGLARMCGISQPHMHNVLKSVRSFSTHSADRLLRALDLQLTDLIWGVSGAGVEQSRAVPLVRNRIGLGTDAVLTAFRGNIPMPGWLLENLIEPLAAHLAPDLVLPAALAANDLVLLDQNPALRADPAGNGLCGLWPRARGCVHGISAWMERGCMWATKPRGAIRNNGYRSRCRDGIFWR